MSILTPASDYRGSQPYRLTKDLADSTRSRSLTWSEPGEVDQDELLLKRLGVRGWGRLHHFRMLYDAGWGRGTGKPVSPRAMHALMAFLERFAPQQGITPSLFLTDRGGIELAWEDEGDSVQVEFHREGIEVYHGARGVEAELGLNEINALVSMMETPV